jgi:hydroxypyruvate reductase
LLAAPVAPLTLADKQAVTRLLLQAGADIAALNAVRKHCSRLKGGGLLRTAARAAGVWTFVLSDVLGDDLATIGSGPTVADPTTFADALAVLDRFGLRPAIPAAVRGHLEAGARGEVAETVKPGDPALARSRTVVVGNNGTAVEAARRAAQALGYATVVLPPLVGDAAEGGRTIAARLQAHPGGQALAFIAGAEPTVQVVPGGRGGRAQHLALAAALALDDTPSVVLAAGTDGIDGPTDAAGALIDGTLAARARARGLDLETALAGTNSYPVLAALGALLRTGPTGTNVSDLVVALRPAC